jgi:hypothetical protein
MKIVFILFVLIHGLIHLMGFVKAFGLSDVKELTLSISRQWGTVWLISCVLFVLVAMLFALSFNYWWVLGIIAVLVSQVLVFYFWKDARFGTIANMIILIVMIIQFGK